MPDNLRSLARESSFVVGGGAALRFLPLNISRDVNLATVTQSYLLPPVLNIGMMLPSASDKLPAFSANFNAGPAGPMR